MSSADNSTKMLVKTYEDILKETETCEVCIYMSTQGKFCSKHFRELVARHITDLRSLNTWQISTDIPSRREARK